MHQGEMIVPAGPAGAMRDALSGGNGGSGNTVHVHVNHSVNINAIDGASIKRFYADSEKILFRQMSDAARRGVHLGLPKIGQT